MANFVDLDKDARKLVTVFAKNNDSTDISKFVTTQYDMIRGTLIQDRIDKKNAKQEAAKNGNSSGPSDKRRAALERLKAHMS